VLPGAVACDVGRSRLTQTHVDTRKLIGSLEQGKQQAHPSQWTLNTRDSCDTHLLCCYVAMLLCARHHSDTSEHLIHIASHVPVSISLVGHAGAERLEICLEHELSLSWQTAHKI
jgi:hypothetical protein